MLSNRANRRNNRPHLAILETEIGDSTHRSRLSFRQIFVDDVDAIRNVTVGLVEQVAALLLEGGESVLCSLGRLASGFEFGVDILESSFRVAQSINEASVPRDRRAISFTDRSIAFMFGDIFSSSLVNFEM